MRKLLLLIIVLIAFFLRVWQIGSIPPSLTWDEVAWGYNAYSLGIDGKDEFGRLLPLNYLESFGDFKPPMYAYLTVLPVKVFGLTEFATRLPSALFGTLTVLVAYFLTKRIFFTAKNKEIIALCACCILAVSPWHIMLSRAGFEANVATFFIVCGVWLFLLALQKNSWYLSLSVASFVFSMYTFNTSRIVSPLFLCVLGLVFIKTLWKEKIKTIFAVIVGIVLIAPVLPFLFSHQASLRFQEVNIFSDVSLVEKSNREIAYDNNIWYGKILHNRRLIYTAEFLHHYFDNLNPAFLFIKGDGNPKFSTQDVGELYLWDIPFVVIGLLFLFRKKEGVWWLIPVWFVLGIIPAATARETPHALRIETTIPLLQIVSAYGFIQFISFFKKQRSYAVTVALLILGINVAYFLHGYYAHYAKEYSGEWQYGYKEAIMYAQSVEGKYDHIEFTDQLGRPYIYVLFYTKANPASFRDNANITRDAFGFVHVNSYGKYVFAKELSMGGKNTLYINVPGSVPANASVQKTFYLQNKKEVLVAYTL